MRIKGRRSPWHPLEQTLLVLDIDLADLALEDLLGLLGELARSDVSFLAIEIVPWTDRGETAWGRG